ncbi:MAG: magnesium/cobalt transporter CorA [Saprospiraceae bacterium]|nr:magnesium/cobalt transporter CorA [Saprospiraceae bacterium]MCB9342425.1 magnesium/cobalt transporter CorA [Lewinellaceae bacterium]
MTKKKKRLKQNRKAGLAPGTLIYAGIRETSPANILSINYGDDKYLESESYSNSPFEGMLWVDIRGLTDVPLIEQVGTDFQIHTLALEDVLTTGQRAKLEDYENGLFFILTNLKLNQASLELEHEQISIFAGKNYVVSFQEDPDDTFEAVRQRIKGGSGRIRKKNSDYLLYALVDSVVDNYFIILDILESTVFELEDFEAFSKELDKTKAKIYALKRVANELKIKVLPIREAISKFQRSENELVDESNQIFIRDLQDHILQILDGVDTQRELIAGLEALHQAEAGNRLNNIMRLLTVISTIFIPLSFLVGLYGMNFDNMPELHTRNGYFILLGLMSCLTLSMLLYFRSKKWL